MVDIDDTAPSFTLPDGEGRPVSLSDYAGKKVILYFYPKDSTPGCTKEACSLRDHNARLQEMGVEVLGVSADKASSHQRFATKHKLNFPLLTDEGWQVARAYGSYGPKKLYGNLMEGLLRQTYLIDEQGKIQKVWRKVATATHGADILEYLEEK